MDKKEIITEWFHCYSDDIYNFLIYRFGDVDVEDIVQEVFIRAMKGLDSFEGNANPKTWLYSIARNLAIDEMRRRTRQKWKSVISFHEKHEPRSDMSPEELLDLKEENKEFFDAIQSLKDSYRDVLILRGVQGISVSETASILQWSERKVHSTYYRAKQALEKRLGGISYE
ncbi:RNA polymerase sigma factor [Evansella sp. AB-rgal1]|uniref:RNA polymerase sigma factor n=1 Tax=Evansella sp. AB-rgal1 TaxID=3242696 RepID=UPI00359CD892